ncbi:MAG: hypothetical protein BZY87_02950 [SAR202 cluster bacterium Io17-Chloro-G6]|nr:MAG: hypothetical protein BZY87_02950 [SAR202 cluster bacterium Io17-Chloro-G6]
MLAPLNNVVGSITRFALGSAFGRVLTIPLFFAAAYFVVALFIYYRGTYDPPTTQQIQFEEITTPLSAHTIFTEQPEVRSGLLVIDGVHRNDFSQNEIVSLLSSMANRGITVDIMGEPSIFGGFQGVNASERFAMLESKLRQAGSLAVIAPTEPYTQAERGLVRRFVEKGGRLLLIGDPTRGRRINTLSEEFGLSFQPGFLYNQVENDLNHRNIFVRDFFPDPVTEGLADVAFYTAGAIRSAGPALAYTDGNTFSTIVEGVEPFYPLAKANQENVLAVGDLTFMVPPQNSILDNNRLIANIAEFLASSDRGFELSDFPYFFDGAADIVLGRSSLLELGAGLRRTLSEFQIDAEVRNSESPGNDLIFLGLYDDAVLVERYLGFAGIQVGETIRTPFAPDMDPQGGAIISLQVHDGRHILIVLADDLDDLANAADRLDSGKFRDVIVSDSIGIVVFPNAGKNDK